MDILKDIPTVGETYLIDCTDFNGFFPIFVPVIGDKHIDKGTIEEFEHIHIDFRFITDEDLISLSLYPQPTIKEIEKTGKLSLSVLRTYNQKIKIEKRYKKCVRRFFFEEYDESGARVHFNIDSVHALAIKNKYKLDKCKICPHKGVNLNNVKPLEGRITCPAHGLRFCEKTGELS